MVKLLAACMLVLYLLLLAAAQDLAGNVHEKNFTYTRLFPGSPNCPRYACIPQGVGQKCKNHKMMVESVVSRSENGHLVT